MVSFMYLKRLYNNFSVHGVKVRLSDMTPDKFEGKEQERKFKC